MSLRYHGLGDIWLLEAVWHSLMEPEGGCRDGKHRNGSVTNDWTAKLRDQFLD